MPVIADLPPSMQEQVVCSISAAVKYEIPANILLAVAEKEGGKPGQWVRNTNGTHDVGPMQFNTAYLRDLKKYGITADHVAAAGCYSYELAAWRIRQHIKNDAGDLWTKAANYHSRTPRFNAVYRADLMRRASKWGNWLEARFVTSEVAKAGVTASTNLQASAVIPASLPATNPHKPAKAAPSSMTGYVPRSITVHN